VISQWTGLRRARLDDQGGVTVFIAICVVALIGIIGVAVDGGSKMRATERADYVAGEAARAAGQAIDPAEAINGTAIVVDPPDAAAAAQAYLRSAGATGTVSVSDNGKTLTVTVTGTYATKFLSVAGIDSLPVTGHATAILLHGVTAPDEGT
jgi:Flp pilus assembly protein TadG